MPPAICIRSAVAGAPHQASAARARRIGDVESLAGSNRSVKKRSPLSAPAQAA